MIFEVGTHDFYEDYVSGTSGTSAIVNGAGCGYGNYGTLIKSIHLNTAVVPNVYDENWTDSAQSQILINEPANQSYFNHPVITYGFNKDLGDNVKRIIAKTDGKYGCKISADHKIAYPNETVNLSASGYGPFNFDSFTIDGASLTGSAFNVNNTDVHVTANFTGNSFIYSGSVPFFHYYDYKQGYSHFNIGLNIPDNLLQNYRTIYTSNEDVQSPDAEDYTFTPNTGYMLALKDNEFTYNIMLSANIECNFSSDDVRFPGWVEVGLVFRESPGVYKYDSGTSSYYTANYYSGQNINLKMATGPTIGKVSDFIKLTNLNSANNISNAVYIDKFTDFAYLQCVVGARPITIGLDNPSVDLSATINYIVSGYI